jgi:hypothetical protein
VTKAFVQCAAKSRGIVECVEEVRSGRRKAKWNAKAKLSESLVGFHILVLKVSQELETAKVVFTVRA